jgi:hypothetical protein
MHESHSTTNQQRPVDRLGLRCARRNGSGWWLVVLCLVVGCHSLNFLRPRDRLEDKDERPNSPAANPVPARPTAHQLRIAPYIFLSDFPLRREQPLFEELAQLRDQVERELLLPPCSTAVQVYLFDKRERYERYMKAAYPDLPPRRAFFIAQPRSIGGAEDLLVFTYWGERIRQDLRHELTHALLHSVIREVPLWLDEGLAEYFELPREQNGINFAHVELLRRGLINGTYKPDLARLEGLRQVDDMNPAEYREAWSWVHLMLHSKPEARTALLSYLQQLRGNRHPGTLRSRLEKVFADPEKALSDHLTALERALPREQAGSIGATSRR